MFKIKSMKRIYKTKWGQVIDLEQLITFMLTDETLDIVYTGGIQEEYTFKAKDCDCISTKTKVFNEDYFQKRIKSEVDDLERAWVKYTYSKNKPVNVAYPDDNIILTDWNGAININNDIRKEDLIEQLQKINGNPIITIMNTAIEVNGECPTFSIRSLEGFNQDVWTIQFEDKIFIADEMKIE